MRRPPQGVKSFKNVPVLGLHVVAEHQLDRVGVEEHLPLEVGDPVFTDVVADQGDRDNQRDELLPVPGDHLEEFLLLVGGENLLEVPHHVEEHVCALFHRGSLGQRLHEEALVPVVQDGRGQLLRGGD